MNRQYSIYLFFLLNEVFIFNQVCKKYVCGNLQQGACINSEDDQVTVQKCENKDDFCPFMNTQNNIIMCTSKKGFHPRSFAGGICNKDSDCIAGNCVNQVCSSKLANEECKNHPECGYGLACKTVDGKKSCLDQSKQDEVCQDDFDCINTHGCSDGKCIEYLSLPLGAAVDINQRNVLPLCQSGFAYEGRCSILKNVGNNPMECDNNNPCKYQTDDGNTTEISEFCICGKNPNGSKICMLGNGESEWSDYLQKLSLILKDTSQCNTMERGLCSSHLKENGILIQEFMIASIKAMRYHEIAGADDCVLSTFYPNVITSKRKLLKIK